MKGRLSMCVLGFSRRTAAALAAALAVCLPAAAAEVVFGGVLGQSQDNPPLAAVGFNSVVVTDDGRAWVLGGGQLFELLSPADPARARLSPGVALPAGTRGGLRSSGSTAWFMNYDGRMCEIVPGRTGAAPAFKEAFAFPDFSDAIRDWTLAPDHVKTGFAAKHRFFMLADRTVYGANPGDKKATDLFTMPPPTGGWGYLALGLLPASGDLLVSTGYDDMNVHRYGADGKEITVQGWPRKMFAERIMAVGDRLFALLAGGRLTELAPDPAGVRVADAEIAWGHSLGGLSIAGPDGWWTASTQGLLWLDGESFRVRRRLGGLPAAAVAATPRGQVLVGFQDYSARVLRAWLDDKPDEPLSGLGNEAWMVAGTWNRKLAGLAWDGARYFAVDAADGQGWRFAPENAVWSRRPWTPATAAKAFNNPRALAARDGVGWVLDAAGLHRLALAAGGDEPGAREVVRPPAGVKLDAAHHVAAVPGGVALALPDELVGIIDGQIAWRLHEAGLGAVATAGDRGVAVAADGARLVLFDAATGTKTADFAAGGVPGGARFDAATFTDNTVVVADPDRFRLLRFAIR